MIKTCEIGTLIVDEYQSPLDSAVHSFYQTVCLWMVRCADLFQSQGFHRALVCLSQPKKFISQRTACHIWKCWWNKTLLNSQTLCLGQSFWCLKLKEKFKYLFCDLFCCLWGNRVCLCPFGVIVSHHTDVVTFTFPIRSIPASSNGCETYIKREEKHIQ